MYPSSVSLHEVVCVGWLDELSSCACSLSPVALSTDEHSRSQELTSSHAYSHGENGAAAVWRQAVRRAWRACRRLVASVKMAKALAWGRGLGVPYMEEHQLGTPLFRCLLCARDRIFISFFCEEGPELGRKERTASWPLHYQEGKVIFHG